MATAADAEIVLRLYELRREETLRKARHFMVFAFQPKTLEEVEGRVAGCDSDGQCRVAASPELLGDGGFTRVAGSGRCGFVSRLQWRGHPAVRQVSTIFVLRLRRSLAAAS